MVRAICGLVLVLFLPGAAPAADRDRSRREAQSLHEQALVWLQGGTVESRRRAVDALERAVLLDPGDTGHELALARACYASGFVERARRHLERVTRVEPYDSAHHLELGLLWRDDWLRYLDPDSRTRARRELVHATVLDTANTDGWLALWSLLTSEDETGVALVAAFRAAKSDPFRPEAALAVASMCQRVGLAHEADSIFRAAIPRLRPGVRERFDDIAPILSGPGAARLAALGGEARASFVEDFWRSRDPEPGTPENEARLEHWARVAQAVSLFGGAGRGDWDERGRTWVRLGPPVAMSPAPVGERLDRTYAAGPRYPTAAQVWTYAGGARVTILDRSLSGNFEADLAPAQVRGFIEPLPQALGIRRMTEEGSAPSPEPELPPARVASTRR